MKEAGDKLAASDKAPVASAIETVRQAASGADVAALRQAISNLQAAAQAMAQHVAQAGGAGAQPPGGGPKDDVIDAEFEVKK